MTKNTVAKTYRLPTALYILIVNEAEKLGLSEADFVHDALKKHFQLRLDDARLSAMEAHLLDAIERNSRNITSLIQQVISMAGPVN